MRPSLPPVPEQWEVKQATEPALTQNGTGSFVFLKQKEDHMQLQMPPLFLKRTGRLNNIYFYFSTSSDYQKEVLMSDYVKKKKNVSNTICIA